MKMTSKLLTCLCTLLLFACLTAGAALAADQTAPTLVSTSPADAATGVLVGSPVTLTFSAPIQAGAAEFWSAITVKRNGSEVVPITPAISGSTLTITPQAGTWDAKIGASYTVAIPAGSIADLSGLTLQTAVTFSFRTEDIVAPTLTASSPANGATSVAANATITLTFSEPIAATASSEYWYTSPVSVQTNGMYVSSIAEVNGKTITLRPEDSNWGTPDGSKVVVTIYAGEILDLSGNAIALDKQITFTLKDLTAPQVRDATPSDYSYDVKPSTPVKLTYDEKLLAGANYNAIQVTNSLGQTIKITKTIQDKVLTIAPASGAWDDSRGYTYTVTVPAKAVKDALGNSESFTTTFVTVDNKPPKLMAIVPANGAANVRLDAPLILLFDEAIHIVSERSHYSLVSSNPSKDQFHSYGWLSYANALIIYPYDSYVWNNGYNTTYTVNILGNEISDPYSHFITTKTTTKFTTIGLLSKKPGSPKAVSSSYSSAKITWTAIPGTTKYEVWRSTSKTGTYTRVGETAATSFTNTSLTTNKTYYYKVRAYQAVEGKKYYSAWSDIVSAKPVPATPSSVKAASAAYNSVKVTWAAVAGATKYEVYRATSSTGTYTKLTETTSTGYTSAGLTTGKVYYYKVRAYRLMGSTKVYGSYSAVVSSKPVPAVPAGVKAARVSASSVKVSWNAVAGAMGYEVYRSTSSGGAYTLAKSTTSLSWTNPGLTTGKTYYFKVRAYRTVGTTKVYGGYSAVVSMKP